MAKKIQTTIKLQLPAGKATPAPPVGPALGQHGINMMAFLKEYNERTAGQSFYTLGKQLYYPYKNLLASLMALIRKPV